MAWHLVKTALNDNLTYTRNGNAYIQNFPLGSKFVQFKIDVPITKEFTKEGNIYYYTYNIDVSDCGFTLDDYWFITQCEITNGYGLYYMAGSHNKNYIYGWLFSDSQNLVGKTAHIYMLASQ